MAERYERNRNAFIAMIVFGLIFIVLTPSIVTPPTEEVPDVKIGQFEAITVHADNEIQTLFSIKNIAEGSFPNSDRTRFRIVRRNKFIYPSTLEKLYKRLTQKGQLK